MIEFPAELPAFPAPEVDAEPVHYRVHLVTGKTVDVFEVPRWDEFVAARSADNHPRVWIRLPSGSLLAPRHVVLIEVFP